MENFGGVFELECLYRKGLENPLVLQRTATEFPRIVDIFSTLGRLIFSFANLRWIYAYDLSTTVSDKPKIAYDTVTATLYFRWVPKGESHDRNVQNELNALRAFVRNPARPDITPA